MFQRFSIILLIFFSGTIAYAQCKDYPNEVLSFRSAEYTMDVVLDHEKKTAVVNQRMVWKNPSPDTISELRFYMYLNSFKNMESTFIKESGEAVFGQDISMRPPDTWGWIEITRMIDGNGNDLHKSISYIQPDDNNINDQSVLSVKLDEKILPGESIELDLDFTAKMPKIIARAGYSKDDYFLFVHWFPQPGVYEISVDGEWGWNCHQFFPSTEFYADFGTYDVSLTVSEHLVLGASGCLQEEINNGDGTKTLRYLANDVIDFAWTAYPYFKEYNDVWEGIDIRLLIPPEHSMLADRYITAVKQALEYLTAHVGEYAYPTITIVDPPLHALRSGLMEYPMLITCGSFYRVPDNIRTIESLVIHEFTHQYFMAMLASNEKEEAWLDEGFVTYFEDAIMDHYYGENCSLFDVFGYRSGNKENSRLEYTTMPNPSVGVIANPGYIPKRRYKGLTYSKASGMLNTIKGLVGDDVMDEIIKTYFERWKFKHPRGKDFIVIANEVISKYPSEVYGDNLNWLFDQVLYGTQTCDYRITSISNIKTVSGAGIFGDGVDKKYIPGKRSETYNSTVSCERVGDLSFPQEVLITWEDGTTKIAFWDRNEKAIRFSYDSSSPIVSAHIDPENKIFLDLDLNNNSKTLKPNKKPCLKYATKAVYWLQNILQLSSAFF